MVDVRARFGFTAAPGATDDASLRHLTLALPSEHAARLLGVQEQGATECVLQKATADALGEGYFREPDLLALDGVPSSRTPPTGRTRYVPTPSGGDGCRAHDLLVEPTGIERIQFDL